MTDPRRAVRVRACAKINLTLRVLGLRGDGYHELRTAFQTLALHDTLTFHPRRGPFVLTADDPSCPLDESNLVWKAAAALWTAASRQGELSGVRVHLRKRIPAEAGLGGGSSDAAATLLALRVLWRSRTSDAELDEVARSLGADVPCFLRGGTLLGLERGDLLFPLPDVPPAFVVLARPDFGVSTRDAYRWWDESAAGRAPAKRPGGIAAEAPIDIIPASEWVNDLEAPVVARHPEIGRLVASLRRSGAKHAAMSGSGSAVFGLFSQQPDAAAAARQLEQRRARVWVTRTVSRRQFARATAPRRLDAL
jgi:4-diphosphocytidyl-2-C-methyl-D-erythritol kinase